MFVNLIIVDQKSKDGLDEQRIYVKWDVYKRDSSVLLIWSAKTLDGDIANVRESPNVRCTKSGSLL